MTYTKEYLDRIEKELNTAVLCDILDELGYRHQAMDSRIYPLEEGYKLVGVARTVLAYDVFEQPKEAYATEIEAVDALREGDIAVCANPSCNNGFWGELMTNAAIARGARGAIIDGAVRDITQIKALSGQFRLFAAGRNPLDSKGRCLVADYDCPIMCGGVRVCAGDLVFGDIDGIVVVPGEVIDKTIELAFEKIAGENLVRDALRSGMLLKDAFAKYGIL
ncbi:MAG: RraA family protein [Eubacteriales bacterium]|nr:RraA family protein [Eubacteriales bacterium]